MTTSSTMAFTSIVEFATIKLATGKTEVNLIEASNVFQNNFLNHQPGFIRRELVRCSKGEYVDIVHWRSQEDIDAVMKKAESTPAVQAYFSVMEFDTETPEEDVKYYSSIAIYETSEQSV